MALLSQTEIQYLIGCQKVVSDPPRREMLLDRKSFRNDMRLTSRDGDHYFHAFFRQSEEFPEDFSVGLDYLPRDGSGSVCLVRCNGPHGEHVNSIDDPSPHHDFHIHFARQENIEAGLRAEKYAENTKEFGTFQDAIRYFLQYCNIEDAERYFPFSSSQLELF